MAMEPKRRLIRSLFHDPANCICSFLRCLVVSPFRDQPLASAARLVFWNQQHSCLPPCDLLGHCRGSRRSVYVAYSSPQVMKVTPAGGQSFLLTQVAVDHAVAGPVHPSCSEHHGVRSSPQQGDHRNSGRHIYHYRNGVVRKSQSQCEPHTQCKLIQRLKRMGSPPKGGLYF